MVKNADQYEQVFSGYTQYDFMHKLVYQKDENTQHSLNIQYSTTTDVQGTID